MVGAAPPAPNPTPRAPATDTTAGRRALASVPEASEDALRAQRLDPAPTKDAATSEWGGRAASGVAPRPTLPEAVCCSADESGTETSKVAAS